MIYSVLRQDIEDWTGNTDPSFLKSINRFIRQAEAKIGMLVQIPANLVQASPPVSIQPGNNLVDLSYLSPQFISVSDFTIPGYGIIQQKSTGFMQEAFPDMSELGQPRYFAMQNNYTLLLGPTPDIAYPTSLNYNGKWPSLVDLGANTSTKNNETFISSVFETALLQGSLMFASLYMQNQSAATTFKAEMMDALGLLTNFGTGAANKPDSERSNASNDSKSQ